MTYDLEHLGRQVDKLSDAIEENTSGLTAWNAPSIPIALLTKTPACSARTTPSKTPFAATVSPMPPSTGLKTSPFSTTKSPTFPPRLPARNTVSGLHTYYRCEA